VKRKNYLMERIEKKEKGKEKKKRGKGKIRRIRKCKKYGMKTLYEININIHVSIFVLYFIFIC